MSDFEDPFAAGVWADVATPSSHRASQLTQDTTTNGSSTTQNHSTATIATSLSTLSIEPSATTDSMTEHNTTTQKDQHPLLASIPTASKQNQSKVSVESVSKKLPTKLAAPPVPKHAVIPNPLFDDPLSVATTGSTATHATASASVPPVQSTDVNFGLLDPALNPTKSSMSASTTIPPAASTMQPHPLDNPFQSLVDPLSQPIMSFSLDEPIHSFEVSKPAIESDTKKPLSQKKSVQALFDPLMSPESHSSNEDPVDNEQNSSSDLLEKQEDSTSKQTLYSFDINVTEPFKVGETLSSHIAYKIKTKTLSPDYRNPEFVVNRRFRDFLWLYNQLVDKYPGVIVPPVPEKHAIGRFQEDFVETRRSALERFICKVAAHPILQLDTDMRLFLESETFSYDKRSDRKGSFMGAFTETTPQVNQPFPKVPDSDITLENRRIQIESMEIQLKSLLKALELLMKQRRDLAQAILEMGDSLVGLANIERSPVLSKKLLKLGDIHKTICNLQEKQAKEDINHIFMTVEEYIRIIGSVKVAYSMRLKAYSSFSAAETNLTKRNDSLTKLTTSSRIRYDKIAVAKHELAEAESQLEESSKGFTAMTNLLISELDRVDREKIADFTESMKTFLASLVDTQKHVSLDKDPVEWSFMRYFRNGWHCTNF
ncbi:Vacuolar protein sorting-associated protein vps5 [Batrachochytrium dendrobatidis]|nr:Vacuolar protein sorting-associated protein vps5 [Batrachochytrium dendrobatidis]